MRSYVPVFPHNRLVPAVASPSRLRQEHVEVMSRMVAAVEALATYRHARRNTACAAAVGDHARYPHEAAFVVFVVASH